MIDDVSTDYILQLVSNVASLTEKITSMQNSVDAMSEKLNVVSKMELDLASLKKDLALTENKAQKSHERIDNLASRVEVIEDKTTARIKKISENALMWILGAIGMLIVTKIKDIIEILWGAQ